MALGNSRERDLVSLVTNTIQSGRRFLRAVFEILSYPRTYVLFYFSNYITNNKELISGGGQGSSLALRTGD